MFDFIEGVTIIDCRENKKLYVSNAVESYKCTIIGHLGNAGTSCLLFRIVQCWRACAVDKENWALPMVM